MKFFNVADLLLAMFVKIPFIYIVYQIVCSYHNVYYTFVLLYYTTLTQIYFCKYKPLML